MNILFTVCGRAGSKGIKNKNIASFLGYPLPFYTISVIDLFKKRNPDLCCDVVVNTDSKDLIKMVREKMPSFIDIIERDIILAGDNTPKLPVILNCYQIMSDHKKINYDMVIDLDLTSPLRTVADIGNLIEKKIISNADVVFSVTEARRNPYFNMVRKTEKGYERVIPSNFNTRQEAPDVFDMNASMYAYSPAFLISQKPIFEGKCEIIRMLDTAVLDLDHEKDLEFMQVIAAHLYENYPEYREVRENIKVICKEL